MEILLAVTVGQVLFPLVTLISPSWTIHNPSQYGSEGIGSSVGYFPWFKKLWGIGANQRSIKIGMENYTIGKWIGFSR